MSKITLLSSFFLFTGVQALILVVGIYFKKASNNTTKYLLSGLLFLIFGVMAYYTVIVNQLASIYPYINSLGSAVWMSIVPFFYLLSKSVSNPRWKLSLKHLVLFFIPLYFVIEELLSYAGVYVNLFDFSKLNVRYTDVWMFLFFTTGIFLSVCSIVVLRKKPRLSVLTIINIILFTLLLVYGIIYVSIRRNYVFEFEYSMIVLLSCLVFWLTFRVFKYHAFNQLLEQPAKRKEPIEKLADVNQSLMKVMATQKPFLNPQLRLATLAEQCEATEADLSVVFKEFHGTNFYDFLSKYRLLHLEDLLSDPDNAQFKIMALATDSGFNSKASFYKAFKDKHGLTPTQYIKQKQA